MTRSAGVLATAARLVVAGWALAGCGVEIDRPAVRAAATTDDAFALALGDAYLALAEAERAEYDWSGARGFLEKAERALAGDPPGLDDPRERGLAEDDARLAGELHAAIVAYRAEGGPLIPAALNADVQAAYECWLHEAAEGHQPIDIALCRRRLETKLGEMGALASRALVVLLPDGLSHAALTVRNEQAAAELDAPYEAAALDRAGPPEVLGRVEEAEVRRLFLQALDATPPAPAEFVLYFLTGTDELTADSEAELPRVRDVALGRPAPRIDVIGHTDRAGAAELNLELARARALRIADLLVADGAPADGVRVRSFGESAPLVPTADGVAEPANRRVEIRVR